MRHLVEERLEEYMSGELSPGEQLAFEEHLASCSACSRSMAEARSSHSYMAWLVPEDAPPAPSPGFYFRVQRAIDRKAESSWLADLTRVLQPQLAYPLLLLMLLSAAWTLTIDLGAEEELLSAFPAQFPAAIFSEADRIDSRDLVMATLVDVTEEE